MNKFLAHALIAQYALSALQEIEKKPVQQSEESKRYHIEKA